MRALLLLPVHCERLRSSSLTSGARARAHQSTYITRITLYMFVCVCVHARVRQANATGQRQCSGARVRDLFICSLEHARARVPPASSLMHIHILDTMRCARAHTRRICVCVAHSVHARLRIVCHVPRGSCMRENRKHKRNLCKCAHTHSHTQTHTLSCLADVRPERAHNW